VINVSRDYGGAMVVRDCCDQAVGVCQLYALTREIMPPDTRLSCAEALEKVDERVGVKR
jgi:hypothetical protein